MSSDCSLHKAPDASCHVLLLSHTVWLLSRTKLCKLQEGAHRSHLHTWLMLLPSKRGVWRWLVMQLLKANFQTVTPKSFPPLGARHDEEHQSRNISVCFFVVDLLTTEKENKPVFISGKPCETLRKSNTAMAWSCWGLWARKLFWGNTFLLYLLENKQQTNKKPQNQRGRFGFFTINQHMQYGDLTVYK